MAGFSCPHVDYVILQHEICPGTNFLDAKKSYFLGVACNGTLWVATLDKVLPSKNEVQNFTWIMPASYDVTVIIMYLDLMLLQEQ